MIFQVWTQFCNFWAAFLGSHFTSGVLESFRAIHYFKTIHFLAEDGIRIMNDNIFLLTLWSDQMFPIMIRFGERYEWPLLTQSIIMTMTMLVMVHLCVTVNESGSVTHVQRRITGKKEAHLDIAPLLLNIFGLYNWWNKIFVNVFSNWNNFTSQTNKL